MKRKPLNRRKSEKMFTDHALKHHRMNDPNPKRGGWRL